MAPISAQIERRVSHSCNWGWYLGSRPTGWMEAALDSSPAAVTLRALVDIHRARGQSVTVTTAAGVS